MTRSLFFYLTILLLVASGCGNSNRDKFRDGDIIFQISLSAQSIAIQKATHSKYSHMGIIFFRRGKPYVYEAIKTIQYTPLNKWISRGKDGHYFVKRLSAADQVLTPDAVARLLSVANEFKGKPYDLTFEWSDDRIYCSELVWKIYDRGLGISIGQLQELRDFDLSDSSVKAVLEERYENLIPMKETVISPSEMFNSDLLESISER